MTIGAALDLAATENLDVVALDVALENLETIFPQQARIVELRFYAGLTIDETAAVLGISPATSAANGPWPAPGCAATLQLVR